MRKRSENYVGPFMRYDEGGLPTILITVGVLALLTYAVVWLRGF